MLLNLVQSKSLYEYGINGEKENYKTQSSEISISATETLTGIVSAIKNGLQNNHGAKTPQPISGDGKVVFAPGLVFIKSGKVVPRTNIVYHELKEMMIIVEEGLERYTDKASTKSAHNKAGEAGVDRAKIDEIDNNGAYGNMDVRIR